MPSIALFLISSLFILTAFLHPFATRRPEQPAWQAFQPNSMNPASSAVSLADVVPLNARNFRTILVFDSIQCDGRFVLHTLATKVLTSVRGRLLWLAGSGAWTPNLIANAMKKMGCEAAASYIRQLSSSNQESTRTSMVAQDPFAICSFVSRYQQELDQLEIDESLDGGKLCKSLYSEIKEWLLQSSGSGSASVPAWIVLDDVSALAALLGDNLAYALVLAIWTLQKEHCVGLIVRATSDHAMNKNESSSCGIMNFSPSWIGAGGTNVTEDNQSKCADLAWERSLVELADGVLDVIPLASGHTREAHGRILFSTPVHGRGWTDQERQPNDRMVNYCLTDTKAQAIRLRSGSTININSSSTKKTSAVPNNE